MTDVLPGDGIHLSASELIALKPRCNALSLPMHRPSVSALAGAYRSRFRGRGVDFVESRAYLPGDDIRNMDWRVTARTGKPHTKIFQEERERRFFRKNANVRYWWLWMPVPVSILVPAHGLNLLQQDNWRHPLPGLLCDGVTASVRFYLQGINIVNCDLPAGAGVPCG